MTAIFVSDLHLDASRPAATACFLRFLAESVSTGDDLFILGDLFEAWIGDDGVSPHDQTVITGLHQLADRGVNCQFVAGNRDFLISRRFAVEARVSLLQEETVIRIGGRPALIMHGDTLCTDDHAYQRYRRIVRNPSIQGLYLALPVQARRVIADFTRRRSNSANATKPSTIMDVNPGAVRAAMRRHGVDLLIHGHTHRPAVHSISGGDVTGMRVVLGDWYRQGSVLRWPPSGPDLQALAFR